MMTNNIPDKLFDLLSQKKYDELSLKEKEQVSHYMTKQDYGDFHASINNLQQVDSEINISIDPFIPTIKEPSTLYKIFHYKIPLYQVAASILIFVCALSMFNMLYDDQPIDRRAKTKKTGVPVSQENYPNDLVFEL